MGNVSNRTLAVTLRTTSKLSRRYNGLTLNKVNNNLKFNVMPDDDEESIEKHFMEQVMQG